MSQSYAKDTSAMDTSAVDTSAVDTSAVDTSIRRLVNHEIERTADRLIKVHGRRAFNHASMKVDVIAMAVSRSTGRFKPTIPPNADRGSTSRAVT